MARSARVAFAWAGAGIFVASLLVYVFWYLVQLDRSTPGEGGPALAFDLALFTIFALHHSLMARTGAKRRLARVIPPELERSSYVWIASLLFLAVCLLWRPIGGNLYRIDGPATLAFYAVQVLGVVIVLWATVALKALDLAGVNQLCQSQPPERPTLSTTGLYGWLRHPVYFGWVLFVFGTPHMTVDRAVFASISTAYLGLAIPLEERSLREAFGEAYGAYARRVRWRMIPGIY
jgi:protein-S-isoprenylcysteine O-methyltransferase Ste14